MPFMPLHNRDAAIPAAVRPIATPFRNRPPIVAIRVTILIPTITAPIFATHEHVTIVVGDALRLTICVGANRDVDLRRLDGTGKRQCASRSKDDLP